MLQGRLPAPEARQRGRATLNRRRATRAEVKAQLRSGDLTLAELVATARRDPTASDPWRAELVRRNPHLVDPHVERARVVAGMRVGVLLAALPGYGPVRVAQALRDVHVDERATLGDLLAPAHLGGRRGAIEDMLHLVEVEAAIRDGRSWTCPAWCVVCRRRRGSWRGAVVVGREQGWPVVQRFPHPRSGAHRQGPSPTAPPAVASTLKGRDALRWGTPAEQAAERDRARHAAERAALVARLRAEDAQSPPAREVVAPFASSRYAPLLAALRRDAAGSEVTTPSGPPGGRA